MSGISDFGRSARELSNNPLGIIALFIVLIYGLASIVVIQEKSLTVYERDIFVWFLVAYPVLVLFTFAWLVSHHPTKLYAPGDFKDQEHWVRMQAEQIKEAIAREAKTPGNDETPGSAS